MRLIRLAVLLALSLAAAPAIAQPPAAQSDDQVVVQGRKTEDAIRDFVAEIGTPPIGANLARWGDTVCVGVYNLAPKLAQDLIDRVSLVGAAVGIEPGEPGCKANVLIMADKDGNALASRLVKDHFRKFIPLDSETSNLGRKALERFKTSGAPVRWWQVSQMVLADTGAAVGYGDSVRIRGASRLRSNVRHDISHIIIILDTTQIGKVSLNSLSDYVAMMALAQIDAESDTREFPTVLNLFADDDGGRTARLTQWDLDYLTALYETPGDAASARRDANLIARKMLNEQNSSND